MVIFLWLNIKAPTKISTSYQPLPRPYPRPIPAGKRVASLVRRGHPRGEPRAFGGEIDHACQRQDEGGFIDHHLRGAAGGQITVGDIDAREPGERDRKSTRMNSSHYCATSMPASA